MDTDILIIDDEADIRDLVSDILKDEGYKTRLGKNSDEALAQVAEHIPSLVILDIWLKDSILDGLGILETIKRKYTDVPVIMISGHGNIETAVNAIRMGAYDYIEKPFKEDRLIHVVKRALEAAKLKRENSEHRRLAGQPFRLVGTSNALSQLKQAIERVAPTNSRVFITGPAGAGKEVVARLIHEKSQRKPSPFVVLNTAGMSEESLESEIFGTEDSLDINSPPRKVGLLERTQGGTLYIDEITELPMNIQGKLVRFLQDNSYERVGGKKPLQANFRVIAASNTDVKEMIVAGRLREDLFYRLNVVPLHVPALKECREDIPEMCRYFLARAAELSGLPERSLTEDAQVAMQTYDWPGNVRQLRNVIEWLLIMAPGNMPITAEMLPREVSASSPVAMSPGTNAEIMSMPLREAREMFERQYLIAQINRFGGNISRTSNFVGMERSALHRKLKSLNVGSAEDK